MKIGKALITFSLVTTFVVSVIVDWNESHIFNPTWPPHARFHDVLLLIFMTQLGVLLTWLMWRRAARRVDVLLATLYTVFFWTPFFYIHALVPSATLGVGGEPAHLHLLGASVHLNALVGLGEVIIAVTGYWLYRRNGQA